MLLGNWGERIKSPDVECFTKKLLPWEDKNVVTSTGSTEIWHLDENLQRMRKKFVVVVKQTERHQMSEAPFVVYLDICLIDFLIIET